MVRVPTSGAILDRIKADTRSVDLGVSNLAVTTVRFQTAPPLKKATIKRETTGEWFVSFESETDNCKLPEKPDVNSVDTSNSVGIDLCILNYIHTSDGKTVD